MQTPITLRDVNVDNWQDVVDLELTDEQKDYLFSNVYSLAESKFNPHAVPLAIYAGDEVIGFFMYVTQHDAGQPDTYAIYRFMIDVDHQGKGYGRKALATLLDQIGDMPNARRITISYVTGNAAAKAFYASFDFQEIGIDNHGEMVAEIRLDEPSVIRP